MIEALLSRGLSSCREAAARRLDGDKAEDNRGETQRVRCDGLAADEFDGVPVVFGAGLWRPLHVESHQPHIHLHLFLCGRLMIWCSIAWCVACVLCLVVLVVVMVDASRVHTVPCLVSMLVLYLVLPAEKVTRSHRNRMKIIQRSSYPTVGYLEVLTSF